jgi:hypothetical protein
MYELVYYSIAEPDFSEPDILQMLNASVDRNRRVGITGCLLYHKGVFVQLLEGEKAKVQSLFEKIAADARHNHVTLLASAEKESRIFNDWNMAFIPLNEDEAAALSRQLGRSSGISFIDESSPLYQLKRQDATHVMWVFNTFSQELLAS